MAALAPVAALLLSATAVAGQQPSDQTLLFYNARIALRENRPSDVLKLWLLRNVLDNRGERGPEDEEFRSVVWAALGQLGLCQDGYPKDDLGGAGLWPLALHNWVVASMGKGQPPDRPSPYGAFELARQQRFVSIDDVLDGDELRTVHFQRGKCTLPKTAMSYLAASPRYDLRNRMSVALLLRKLLQLSLVTLSREKVGSVAAIEARIFDLELALAEMQARRARQEALAARQRAKRRGLSDPGIKEVLEAKTAWQATSEQTAFLRRSLAWKPEEWMILSPPRRLFLFSHARRFAGDQQALDALELAIIDLLVDRRAGAELEAWIGFFDATGAEDRRRALTSGDRGRRILDLDPSTGFRERAAISIYRGVSFLEAGELHDALRSFAYAMSTAEEARDPATTTALARRWLSYVLAHHETSDEVIATLKALVPKQEYNAVIEDLVWTAALRADAASFDRIVASARHGGAFDTRAAKLRPLSRGNVGELATMLRDAAEEEPHLTMRFVGQLFEKIETQDADVRAANIPTIKLIHGVLDGIAAQPKGRSSQIRVAEELIARGHAILEGLSEIDRSIAGKARALSSAGREAFAGNVRLAPADPLPWPFRAPEPEPPSVFVPIVLSPVEWRVPEGALVFGWRIAE